MSDDFTTRLREVAGLKEGCDPSTANILLGCAEYIERLQRQERARIVAALRERAECIRRVVKAMQAVPRPDYRQIEYDQARADGVMSAADAIERGEL